MNSDLHIAGDLRRAAEYIRVNGWWSGGSEPDDDSVCIMQAVGEAIDATAWPFWSSVVERLAEACGALGFERFPLAFQWNDAPGRTVEEVLDRLESAALGLEVRALSQTLEVAVPLEPAEVSA